MFDGETGGNDAFFGFGVFNWNELSSAFSVKFGGFIVANYILIA